MIVDRAAAEEADFEAELLRIAEEAENRGKPSAASTSAAVASASVSSAAASAASAASDAPRASSSSLSQPSSAALGLSSGVQPGFSSEQKPESRKRKAPSESARNASSNDSSSSSSSGGGGGAATNTNTASSSRNDFSPETSAIDLTNSDEIKRRFESNEQKSDRTFVPPEQKQPAEAKIAATPVAVAASSTSSTFASSASAPTVAAQQSSRLWERWHEELADRMRKLDFEAFPLHDVSVAPGNHRASSCARARTLCGLSSVADRFELRCSCCVDCENFPIAISLELPRDLHSRLTYQLSYGCDTGYACRTIVLRWLLHAKKTSITSPCDFFGRSGTKCNY